MWTAKHEVSDLDSEAQVNKLKTTLLIVIFLVGLDQLTKTWALRNLTDKNLFIPGTQIGFSLTTNSGSAFSMFQSSTFLLTMFASLITVGVAIGIYKSNGKLVVISLSLILAGALGNLADRYFREPGGGLGHVIDFIKFQSFPTFNIADSCVVIGAMLLVYSSFRSNKVENNEHA